ncbi:hypothetical protein O4H52_22330 [Sphingomonadaceae bacterium G21617-S1]|jgi:hypothetical protein|nr:hypothetical protein [Sphingomonadaceae bacterium G21617-S1]
MGQVAVYSEVERRRRWSDDERLQMLGEAFSPGAVVTQGKHPASAAGRCVSGSDCCG